MSIATTISGKRVEQSAEERAKHIAIRKRFAPGSELPTIDEMIDSGEMSAESNIQSAYVELLQLVHALKAERTRLGWSQAEASTRAGLTAAVISALESGRTVNPTLNTLYRYALSLGVTIRLMVEPTGHAGE